MTFQNTKQPKERPTEEPYYVGEQQDGVQRRHPAFGMIGAFRTESSGGLQLFGTAVDHRAFITIEVHEAVQIESMHQSRPFAVKMVCRLCLSEAQWVTFVSAPNVGNGVPCTLDLMRSGSELVRLPEIDDETGHARRKSDIEAEVKKRTAQYQAAVDALDALLKQPKVTKADLDRVRKMFLHPVDYAATNAAFVAESLTEHVEHLEADVKQEIDAYVTQMAMKFPGLTGNAPVAIEGTVKKGEDDV